MSSPRFATMRESSCFSAPAAALRGLANGSSLAAILSAFTRANCAVGKYTSPRTSRSFGQSFIRAHKFSGRLLIVRKLAVMSSPVAPSPRVAPTLSNPFS
jgi:hypothetical protein